MCPYHRFRVITICWLKICVLQFSIPTTVSFDAIARWFTTGVPYVPSVKNFTLVQFVLAAGAYWWCP